MYDHIDYKRDRRHDAAVSLYLINNESPELVKVSCMFCKRTIFDMKGTIDRVVDAPQSSVEFGVVINMLCKQCHQSYRLVTLQSFIGVIA